MLYDHYTVSILLYMLEGKITTVYFQIQSVFIVYINMCIRDSFENSFAFRNNAGLESSFQYNNTNGTCIIINSYIFKWWVFKIYKHILGT